MKRAVGREFARSTEKTVNEARDAYEQFLLHEKGNKPRSVADTIYRLGVFFPDGDLLLGEITPQKCTALYVGLRERSTRNRKPFSVDSHRNILAEAKSFLRWCSAKKRWILRNPLEGVEGVGKRHHGKKQLRIDEARKWMAKAVELADAGEEGAVAAIAALVMGMRANEIVSRVARDLDDEGRLLWIPESKTEAGRRTLQVPEVLQPHLRRLVEGKAPEVRIFAHDRDWIRDWVRRICKAAEVPVVTAHGMRGLHSTLAVEHGITGHIVAASLGHDSFTTTTRSYAQAEAVAGAQQRRVLKVLQGGKAAS